MLSLRDIIDFAEMSADLAQNAPASETDGPAHPFSHADRVADGNVAGMARDVTGDVIALAAAASDQAPYANADHAAKVADAGDANPADGNATNGGADILPPAGRYATAPVR